jgi:hypothetical protein
MLQLPMEIVILILLNLSVKVLLLRLSRVCKTFYNIVGDNFIWSKLLERDVPWILSKRLNKELTNKEMYKAASKYTKLFNIFIDRGVIESVGRGTPPSDIYLCNPYSEKALAIGLCICYPLGRRNLRPHDIAISYWNEHSHCWTAPQEKADKIREMLNSGRFKELLRELVVKGYVPVRCLCWCSHRSNSEDEQIKRDINELALLGFSGNMFLKTLGYRSVYC